MNAFQTVIVERCDEVRNLKLTSLNYSDFDFDMIFLFFVFGGFCFKSQFIILKYGTRPDPRRGLLYRSYLHQLDADAASLSLLLSSKLFQLCTVWLVVTVDIANLRFKL